MKDVNKVILIGRLGAHPILRQTKNGTQVAHLSVATSRRMMREEPPASSGGSASDETQWHRVVAWGKLAEICSQFLKKGNAVYIEGFLKGSHYQDKQGTTRSTMEIHAENMSFLGGGSSRPDLRRNPELNPHPPEETAPFRPVENTSLQPEMDPISATG